MYESVLEYFVMSHLGLVSVSVRVAFSEPLGGHYDLFVWAHYDTFAYDFKVVIAQYNNYS